MYWKLETKPCDETDFEAQGRFVLHRHVDADGPHLDLRIESGESLHGWRIEAENLHAEAWATEKLAHPLRWLDEDGGLERLDAGTYAWRDQSGESATLVLSGTAGCRSLHARKVPALPAAVVRAIRDAIDDAGIAIDALGDLITDGLAARERAIARLCGLGRELDGTSFDASVWRKSLSGLSLEEVHAHLRTFETRFDARYPAQPVSRPSGIDEVEDDATDRAMAILRD